MLSVSSGHRTEISIIITININNINILPTNSRDFLIYSKEQKHYNCKAPALSLDRNSFHNNKFSSLCPDMFDV